MAAENAEDAEKNAAFLKLQVESNFKIELKIDCNRIFQKRRVAFRVFRVFRGYLLK